MIGGKVGATRTKLPSFIQKSRLMPADVFKASEDLPADQALPARGYSQTGEAWRTRVVDRARGLAASPLLWLLVATFAVRIVGIDRPITGTFATKAAVHAMVARNWALGRAPYHQPTIDLLNDGVRSWHLMEWPAASFVAAMAWKLFGGSLDAWGRGISIACSLISVWLVYRLADRWFGSRAAQGAAFVFAFSPVSIVYGQSFLLESSLAMLTLATLSAFDRWLDTRNTRWLVLAAIAVALAILTKIYMLALFVPLAAMFYDDVRRRAANTSASSALSMAQALRKDGAIATGLFGLVLLPVATWYVWVFNVPHEIGPATDYHPLGRATVHGFPHPALFTIAYYTRLTFDFATVVLTPLGVILAGYGLVDSRFRRQWPLCAAFGLLLIAFPLKFIAANYYYVVLLPALTFAAGLGWQRLLERIDLAGNNIARRTAYGVAALSLLIAMRYAIGPAYRSHPEDRAVVAAAAAVRARTKPEEPVATIHGSTIDLLYYCDRPGWAFDADDELLERKFRDANAVHYGAKILVVAGLDDQANRPVLSRILSRLPLLDSGDDWRIYLIDLPPVY
jgi:hypothetical protein